MKISPVFILAGIIFLASCAKLPVYESKSYSGKATTEFPNSIADNFDKKANVNYGFANDSTHFYVQAVFQDRESFMNIMRGGLVVYFDPNGKKGKDYQLKIEKSEQQLNDFSMLSVQGANIKNGETQSIPSIISMALTKVTWDKNGKEFVFYRNLLKEPIWVELSPAGQDQLILNIKMPISEIPLPEGNSIFSLGIVTGKNSVKGMSGNGPGSSGGGVRPGGGMGGGMHPGGGMGGPGGGGMRGGGGRPAGAPPSASGMNPIEIWCKVKL